MDENKGLWDFCKTMYGEIVKKIDKKGAALIGTVLTVGLAVGGTACLCYNSYVNSNDGTQPNKEIIKNDESNKT